MQLIYSLNYNENYIKIKYEIYMQWHSNATITNIKLSMSVIYSELTKLFICTFSVCNYELHANVNTFNSVKM